MAPIFKIAALLNLSLYVAAQGTQFITGACTSDADCADGCCGFNSGKCAGPVVAQERDGGCGFGDAQPNDNAAKALTGGQGNNNNNNNNQQSAGNQMTAAAAAPPAATAGAGAGNGAGAGAGNGAGTQFITGACTSDADCGSGCCGFNTGKCAGAVVAQERDGGCGFGDAQPNNNAAQALTGGNAKGNANANAKGNGNGNGNNVNNQNVNGNGNTISNSQAQSGNNNGNNTQAQGAGNNQAGGAAGGAQGTQFITGPCTSDADCASGCCGFNTGKCAGAVVAQERDGGCGFGDAQPNDNAAQALKGQRLGKRGVAHFIQALN